MVVGIEASNIRAGGGITHLKEIIENLDPRDFGISKVVLFTSKSTAMQISDYQWLIKADIKYLNSSSLKRNIWQFFKKESYYRKYSCDVVYSPGALISSFDKYISMCQNQLPFDKQGWGRFKTKFWYLYFFLLRTAQLKSFKNSGGIIFLSNYSVEGVLKHANFLNSKDKILIPHGLNKQFLVGEDRNYFKNSESIKLLCVSAIAPYKCIDNLLMAVNVLLDKGLNVELTIVGKTYKDYVPKIQFILNNNANLKNKVNIIDQVPYNTLKAIYLEHDIFVYPSICETFGMTVLEAMGTGIPIACSNRGAMKEILKDAGVYFDSFQIDQIANSIEVLISSKEYSKELGRKGFEYSKNYEWRKSSYETFKFIKEHA